MLYEISGYIGPRCSGTYLYVRKYMYMRTSEAMYSLPPLPSHTHLYISYTNSFCTAQ